MRGDGSCEWLNKICGSWYRARYRVWMGAEELDIEKIISMTTMKYSFYRMNLKYDKYGQPNIAQQQNNCKNSTTINI